MIRVVGLGPGALDRVPEAMRDLLADPDVTVVARTLRHPAAAELAQMRDVISCDDLYEAGAGFGDVYEAIVDRLLELSAESPVIYAVPGSPRVGEFAVRRLIESGDVDVEVLPGESFVDAILGEIGYDPFERGLQVLDGHDLPDPLILDKPTIVGHLDHPQTFGDALDAIGRVVPEETVVTVIIDVGGPEQRLVSEKLDSIPPELAGLRTSLWVDAEPGGLVGAVKVMRRLRDECPWDREQTHRSLVPNLLEEAYELIEAINRLPEDGEDWVAYSAVEDELGDVLLQVLFHEAIARQAHAFDIDGAAEVLRQKLVRRHPHVFGDVDADSPDEVKRNWDAIKAAERGGPYDSALDGVPSGLPAVQRASKVQNRAAKVGFDWSSAAEVVPKVEEELAELTSAMGGDGDVEAELGDLLFSIVNLSRHLGVDAELALRKSVATFERRFRLMEQEGPMEDLDLDEMNERWERSKGADRHSR